MVLSGKSKRLVVSRSNLCTKNSEKCMLGRGKGGKGKGKAGKYYYKRSTMKQMSLPRSGAHTINDFTYFADGIEL